MDTKEELHHLVNQLSDVQACRATSLLRHLVDDDEVRPRRDAASSGDNDDDVTPPRPLDLAALAAEQGVKPILNRADFIVGFAPVDEDADEFNATIRRWRREGGYA